VAHVTNTDDEHALSPGRRYLIQFEENGRAPMLHRQRHSEHGWTLVLRRQAARVVDGRPEGGYTDAFELICCDCGDNPDLGYRDVSPELQRIRGPYLIAAGIGAYEKHVHHHRRHALRPGESPTVSDATRVPWRSVA
jgi:hypothetical protein